MEHKKLTCPNANPDSDELCPIYHKCEEPECIREEGHTGFHFAKSEMPPKTNEELIAEFGKLKALSFEDGSIRTNIKKCQDWLRTLLTTKDKEKEEAVADIISVVLDAEIKTGDKDEILMMLQALTPHTN